MQHAGELPRERGSPLLFLSRIGQDSRGDIGVMSPGDTRSTQVMSADATSFSTCKWTQEIHVARSPPPRLAPSAPLGRIPFSSGSTRASLAPLAEREQAFAGPSGPGCHLAHLGPGDHRQGGPETAPELSCSVYSLLGKSRPERRRVGASAPSETIFDV